MAYVSWICSHRHSATQLTSDLTVRHSLATRSRRQHGCSAAERHIRRCLLCVASQSLQDERVATMQAHCPYSCVHIVELNQSASARRGGCFGLDLVAAWLRHARPCGLPSLFTPCTTRSTQAITQGTFGLLMHGMTRHFAGSASARWPMIDGCRA
jgi:hypothetical protein